MRTLLISNIGAKHCLLAALCIACLSAASGSFAKELKLLRLEHKGITRSYYLHNPENHHDSKPLPLVLALHGGGRGNGRDLAKYTGLNRLADENAFLAVYPNGLNNQWNDGRGQTVHSSESSQTDDVSFISALIDHLVDTQQADARKVYVVGVSNGGMMTLRLGCELDAKLSAIAAVIANMPTKLAAGCTPRRALPVLLMNGTQDPIMPWSGGAVHFGKKTMGRVLSAMDTAAFWVKHNRCKTSPEYFTLPDLDSRDASRITLLRYAPCHQGAEVLLYKVEGGGHHLPGGRGLKLLRILGNRNQDIKGVDAIWRFFSRHRQSAAPDNQTPPYGLA